MTSFLEIHESGDGRLVRREPIIEDHEQLAAAGRSYGRCFPGMGQHYVHDIDSWHPSGGEPALNIIYNSNGELSGFASVAITVDDGFDYSDLESQYTLSATMTSQALS